MHGHSRKKNVFIYGPHYPLHSEKYYKMRIIPKLLADMTDKFRYYSCKFRIEKSKEKAARIVLWREFNLMNCFTFEGSFHGFLMPSRETREFGAEEYQEMGEHLSNSLFEYLLALEEDERQRKFREIQRKRKRKTKSTKALSHKESKRELNPNEPADTNGELEEEKQPMGIKTLKQIIKEVKKEEKKMGEEQQRQARERSSSSSSDGSDSEPGDDQLSVSLFNIESLVS